MADHPDQHRGVVPLGFRHVLPPVASLPGVIQGVGGHSVSVRWLNAGCFQRGAHDGGPVGPMRGERLTGPGPRDEHPSPAQAEVVPVVRRYGQ